MLQWVDQRLLAASSSTPSSKYSFNSKYRHSVTGSGHRDKRSGSGRVGSKVQTRFRLWCEQLAVRKPHDYAADRADRETWFVVVVEVNGGWTRVGHDDAAFEHH